MSDAAPFKIDGVYCKLIPLTRGCFAIVDAADYEWLDRYVWMARPDSRTRAIYAERAEPDENRKRHAIGMHRQILGLSREDPRLVDHINHVPLDMRRQNLRVATKAQNCRNSRKSSRNTSGFKGVGWDAGESRWRARIRVDGNLIHLGRFISKTDAVEAYRNAAARYHGEFCCTE